jgi:hypothetical protein
MTKPTTSEMKTFTLEELGELNVYFGEHGELPHGVEEALLEMATGYHELRLATAETMTKPTTESGAPIEFTLRGYKFRLCLEQWSDGGSREFGWAHGERVAAEHLAAALQANPELRAQVLGAFWGPEDIAENNKRAAELWRAIGEPSLRASLEAAESELALMYSAFLPQHAPKNPREARQILERLCDYESELERIRLEVCCPEGGDLFEHVVGLTEKVVSGGLSRSRLESELAKCRAELELMTSIVYAARLLINKSLTRDGVCSLAELCDADLDELHELLATVEETAPGDQEAAAVEPERCWSCGARVAAGYKRCCRCNEGPDGVEPAPPEAPKLPGGLGPVDDFQRRLLDINSEMLLVAHRALELYERIAVALERGRQR